MGAVFLVQCSARTATTPEGGPPIPPASPAILFIGNSLTEANDLPHRVQELSRDAGAGLEVSAVVAPGFSLEDHLGAGRAVARIRSRRWSIVVLQQGPSTLPDSRAALIRDAAALAGEIRAAGARPALLMVWPLTGQRQEDVSASYRAAAKAAGSVLLPAGDAWQAAAGNDPALVMTVADRFHPSALGTYLAALTIHCALHGGLPAPPPLAVERQRASFALSEAQARILRQAACAPAR